MLIHYRKWKEIVNTKTKPLTRISILRWTLIRYGMKLMNQSTEIDLKKNIFKQEMIWLRNYWGQAIPLNDIHSKYWNQLFHTKSLNIRRDIYEYLSDNERRKEKMELKIKLKKQELLKRKRKSPSTTIFSLIRRKSFSSENLLNLSRLVQAARLNDYFIVDGGFEFAHTRQSYFISLVQRVIRCFKYVHYFHSPSYIILSDLSYNLKRNSSFLFYEKSNYFHSTNDLYIDLFNKDRFIYLTPDSPNEMNEYDHNAIYILGGIYDDQNKEQLTYQKALRQNIRHVKLPLDKYLVFHPSSSQSLAFHEVYNILLTLKHTNNNWIKAFDFVPNRKIKQRISFE